MKILIRLPNWLGDVVMSTAFTDSVRKLFPEAIIDVIVKKELTGIAAMIEEVNNVYPFSKTQNKGLTGAYRFGRNLRSENYDLFFNLPSSLSSVVLAWATRSKKRVGFDAEGGRFLLTNFYPAPSNQHRVDEYISLLERFTGKPVADPRVALKVDIADRQLSSGKVLINFNSEAQSRRMPVNKAISIVNTLTRAFVNTTFTLIGSPKEAAFAEQIVAGVDNKTQIENAAGKTNLQELAAEMACAGAILTTDSGPAHLANGLGTPAIVLFGAGNENNTSPYNKDNLVIQRAGKLPCEPCVKNTCPLYDTPKCMELLDEMQMIDALSVYLPYA
ncbi:MAG TPA: lipopolysaccharide heptosyltransferase II [Mucilaginibacter sp.]|nr:lipopolysaccharide heptosyltransferase II [Mucilaginibacter sp.]